MQTQKILKPKNKIVVVADYRERGVIENLKELGAKVNRMNLAIGDFIASKDVAIERKEHNDFISSIINGRVFKQAGELKKNFKKPIIIIEGYSNNTNINPNALKGALASLLLDYNISIINTRNPMDTARMIYWIAKREQVDKNKDVVFKTGKKPKDKKRFQEMIVSSLPGVSTVISKRLLKHFKNVEKVFSSSEEELQEVEGIGKVLANKIRKILTLKY